MRHTYSVKYQEFINEIQRHADEVGLNIVIKHFKVHLILAMLMSNVEKLLLFC